MFNKGQLNAAIVFAPVSGPIVLAGAARACGTGRTLRAFEATSMPNWKTAHSVQLRLDCMIGGEMAFPLFLLARQGKPMRIRASAGGKLELLKFLKRGSRTSGFGGTGNRVSAHLDSI